MKAAIIALFVTSLFGLSYAAPITQVPPGGWEDDSYYIATPATWQQIKTFLQNYGVNVQRVRDYLVGEVPSAPENGDSVYCTRRNFVVVDGYKVIEIDRRLMRRYDTQILALVNNAPNSYLFSRTDIIARIIAATEVTSVEVGQ